MFRSFIAQNSTKLFGWSSGHEWSVMSEGSLVRIPATHTCFFKIGPFPDSFFFIFVFSIQFLIQLTVNNIADDWIRTADL